MDIIQELENQFKVKSKTGTIQEKEKIAVDFLCGVDFSNQDNKVQAERYIKHILSDFVEKNEEITSLEAKIVHCMIAKISLDKLGLSDVKINYVDKTAQDSNAGAYYRDTDNSINFFNNDVSNKHEWTEPYGIKEHPEKGAASRLDYFAREVFKLEHEIQHAVQFKNMSASEESTDTLTPESYVISRQYIARIFAQAEGSKYYKKGLDADRLYNDNHDQFYYEIDADKHGIERALDILKTVSPQAYQIATDPSRNRYVQKLAEKTDQLNNYSIVHWKHNTNPEMIEVGANHKASMIIDNILPQLSGKQRKEFMDKYPALSIIYNADGSLKTLEQVEREKQVKIRELLINGTDNEIQEKVPNIFKVYDTAIESHPVLCFEKCLQHMARISWNSDRYFTDSGVKVRYNSSEVRKELRMAQEKAKAIASYMEDTDARRLKIIFERYKKELMSSPKLDQTSARFFEDKKLAIYGIESQIYRNKEVKSAIEKDTKEAMQKRKQTQKQRAKAEKIIQKVFPDFRPYPQIGILKDGSVEFLNNVNEKLMLMEAYKQYVKIATDTNSPAKQDKNFIASSKLLLAIDTIYSFNATTEEKAEFEKALKSGKVKIIGNIYEPKTYSQKDIYTQEDRQNSEGKVFSFKKTNQLDSTIEGKQKHPSDPESDAEKSRYVSQRQVAAQRQQEIMEEKAYNQSFVPGEESADIKQQNNELETRSREEQIRQETIRRRQQENKQREQEETYEDEYGVVRKRQPLNNQTAKQQEHHQDTGLCM